MTAPRVSARRRAFAVAALGAAVALIVAVALVLLRNQVSVVFGLVGLFIAVAGGWWVISEPMPRRGIGVAGVVIGFIVIVVSIVMAIDNAERIVVRTLIIVALYLVTLECARAAMRIERHHLHTHTRDAGPPHHAVLLCNPWSGGGKVERFGLVERARELGVETVMLDHGLDLEQLARDAVARGADCLGMAGGDGSQALVASIAVEHGLPFVCVSAGTRNHFALDLGLNRDDPRESMDAFRDAVERTVDYATVNGRFFVNNVSLGVYATVVQEESYRDAKVDTTKTLLPQMLGRQSEPFDLQFTTPDGEEVDGAIVVMVSNNPYVIGTSPDNAQRRRLDRGELGVFAVTTSTGSEAARLLTATAIGARTRSRFWQEFTASTFEIRSRSGTAFAGIDGEALELSTPMRFEIHPRGLTLLVPRGNVEAAERRRAREVSIRHLFAVAAGHEPTSSA